MSMINCSVFEWSTNQTLLPWCIMSVGESGVTVQQFYDEKIVFEVGKWHVMDNIHLESAFLGKSKDSLDRIELSLPIDPAIQLFGPFFAILYICM